MKAYSKNLRLQLLKELDLIYKQKNNLMKTIKVLEALKSEPTEIQFKQLNHITKRLNDLLGKIRK